MSEGVELSLGKMLAVVPLTLIAERTVTPQIKIVAKPGILGVQLLKIVFVNVKRNIQSLTVLVLEDERRRSEGCRRCLRCLLWLLVWLCLGRSNSRGSRIWRRSFSERCESVRSRSFGSDNLTTVRNCLDLCCPKDASKPSVEEALGDFSQLIGERWTFEQCYAVVDGTGKREGTEEAGITIVGRSTEHDMLAVVVSIVQLKVCLGPVKSAQLHPG